MDWQLRLCEWLQRAVNTLDMKSLSFLNQDCAVLKNDILQLLVSRSIGPRILSLRFHKGRNLLAELPDLLVKRPDGKPVWCKYSIRSHLITGPCKNDLTVR